MADEKCQKSGWCAPLIIYLVLNVLGLIAMARNSKEDKDKKKTIAQSIMWTVLWSLVFYTLCSTCNEGWAWLLLILPFVLLVFFLMGLFMGLFSQLGKCELPNKTCFDTFNAEQCSKQGGVYTKGQMCESK